MRRTSSIFFFGMAVMFSEATAQQPFLTGADSLPPKFSFQVLPQNFYNQHLSFFCKKEVQLQKFSSLPLFIRIGSKDYVDYLEKKPNAVWRPKP